MNKHCLLIIFLLICNALLLMGCAENPVSHENQFIIIDDQDEILLGQEADLQIKEKFGIYNDPALTAYVNKIGQKIAAVCDRPNIPYHFTILDTSMVNAFALPGGYIYVTRGILARLNSEAELANVLGHEITHVSARHGAQRLSQAYGYQLAWIGAGVLLKQQNVHSWKQAVDLGVQLALLGYSRENEFEADHIGTEYALRAGYSPKAMGSFLHTLRLEEHESPEFLSWLATHPPTEERIAKVDQRAEQLIEHSSAEGLEILADKYKEKINGLEIGPSQRSGIINGRQYKNPYYGCRITAPKKWKLSSAKHQALVVLKAEDKKYTVYLQAAKLDKDLPLEEWMNTIEKGLGEQVRKVKGFPNKDAHGSYSAFYEEKVKDLGLIIARRDYLVKRKTGYVITYLARAKDYDKGTVIFDEIFSTFTLLPAEEIKRSYSQYLVVYTVQAGDTVQSIAVNKLHSAKLAERIVEYNGLDATQPLYPGQKIKLPPKDIDIDA